MSFVFVSAGFMLAYLNEYNVASAVYMITGAEAGTCKVWVDHIRRSQEAYKKLRSTAMDRTESRLMYPDMYDDTYEMDYAIFHANHHDPEMPMSSSASASSRLSSAGAADHHNNGVVFRSVPSASSELLPRSISHNQLQHQPRHMSSSGHNASSHQRFVLLNIFVNYHHIISFI